MTFEKAGSLNINPGDEEEKREWRRTTEDVVEPNALVREVFSDPLSMHEDAVFGLNA